MVIKSGSVSHGICFLLVVAPNALLLRLCHNVFSAILTRPLSLRTDSKLTGVLDQPLSVLDDGLRPMVDELHAFLEDVPSCQSFRLVVGMG